MPASEIGTYELLGVRVTPMPALTLYGVIEGAIESGRRCVIGNHNLHSVYLFHRDAKMRRYYELADYVFVDGMPLIWTGRALGMPLRRDQRITSVDWLPPLLRRAAGRGWRVMLLGSRPGVALRAAERLRREYPGLEIAAEHGYFDAAPDSREDAEVFARIEAFDPHVLCVCMGMPRQEHWILDHHARLGPGVTLSLGAFMDYLTGEVPVPPRWMGRVGLEWAFRLVSSPRRVWRRYLVEPWVLLPYLVRELRAGRRSYAHDR
jgi:N-acetylglucosaminyldiphosphoundecaprenol N-acetyl-beta-D-mannosaminyltransferase